MDPIDFAIMILNSDEYQKLQLTKVSSAILQNKIEISLYSNNLKHDEIKNGILKNTILFLIHKKSHTC